MHPLYIDRKLDDDLVQCFREPFIYSDASSEYVSLNHEDTPPQFQHEYDLSNEEEFKKEDEIYMFTHMPSRISGAINLSQKFDDESSRRLISLEHTHSNFDKRTDVTKDQLSLPDINLPFIVPSQYRIFLKLPQLDVADFYNHISDTAKNNILRQTDLNQVDMSSCTRCSLCLNTIYEDDIVCMWALNDLDCSVKCNQCQSKITPKLTIKYTGSLPTDVTNEIKDIDVTSSLPIQEGVQFQLPELCQIKDKVQIKVPYLNPMCLRRLIEITISKDSIIQHELLSGDHAIILWNLMWIHARFTNDESLSQLFSIKIRCFWRLPEFEDNITARVPLYLIKRHLCKESNPVHFDSQSSILSMNIRRLSCVGHLVLQIYRFLQLNDIYSAIEVTVYLMHSGRWPFLNSEVVVNIQLLFKEILFIYMDLKQSTINSDDNGNSKNQDVNDHINFDLYDFFYEQFRKAIEITPVLWNLNDKPCVHLLQMKRDYRKMFHRIRL
ncbi:hypothetical protein GJ496_008122 [Pomphorhynchus laevis]|nr:hypothetical protein GJ496_008122 [Pomphorhynchus laevis]